MTFFTQARPSNRSRWSDDDWYFGPFTYTFEPKYKVFGIELVSGDDDDYPGCSLRVRGFGHTFIVHLPPIITPYKEKVFANWDEATVKRLGRNWYYNSWPREYGFYVQDNFLCISYGVQTHDSSSEKSKGYFLPWMSWRHIRHSLYDLKGEHVWTEFERKKGKPCNFSDYFDAKEKCPSAVFSFRDYDGEELKATTVIEEREWRLGEGLFKWLSLFAKPKIRRSIDIEFSGETGKRKGSWKGGTIGTGINLLPGELHESAFKRYCLENNMTFVE